MRNLHTEFVVITHGGAVFGLGNRWDQKRARSEALSLKEKGQHAELRSVSSILTSCDLVFAPKLETAPEETQTSYGTRGYRSDD